jgi:hypothetical protein
MVVLFFPTNNKIFLCKNWQNCSSDDSKKFLEDNNFSNFNWDVGTSFVSYINNNICVLDLDIEKNEKNTLSSKDLITHFIKENDLENDIKYIIETSSSSLHLYFKYSEKKDFTNKIKLKINDKIYGVDFKSKNGQVIIPSSLHQNSNKYKILKGNINKIEEMPDKLYEYLLKYW